MGSIRNFSPSEYIPVVIGGTTSTSGGTTGDPLQTSLTADAKQAALTGGLWTLGSASVVESIAIPSFARGFRLRPSSDTRFAISEDPVASGAEVLTVGNTAYAGETEVRLLGDPAAGRTLRLLTTVAGSTVGVGFF